MGSSRWDDDDYHKVVTDRVADRGTAFAYNKDVKSGAVPAKTHDVLDPKNLKVRESRDSKEHPESNAVIVCLDVTGSMGAVIDTIHEKLPGLMGLLLRKGYLPDPQIMFCAIADITNHDPGALQVGQFESGIEMEGDLSKFVFGGGGGSDQESYELMMYVAARKTSVDCLEKRGKKGYCFFIGDERPYETIKKRYIDQLVGPGLESDIPTEKMVEELKEKYDVFFILPTHASHGKDPRITSAWEKLLGGENVLRLEDASGVAELIASQIGVCEGADVDTVAKDLKDVGTSAALVKVIEGSVSRAHGGGGAVTRMAPGALAPSSDPSSVKRL